MPAQGVADGRLLQPADRVLLPDLREQIATAPLEWLGIQSTCDQCTQAGTVGTDFGDAPDQGYRTLLASNGARHSIVPGIFLGGTVDAESDGRPDATASGDDRNGADEDGVVFTSTLHVGQDATIEVAASTEGYLNAWIDFDGDGQFDDREDTIFADQTLTRGVNRLTFPVPAYAASGWTFARFRFNTRGLLDSFGPADDGEVEDYRVEIVASHDPQAISGASRLAWNQPPSVVAGGSNQVFQAGGVPSALHLHEIAADDWQSGERSARHGHSLVGHVRPLDRILSAAGSAAGVSHRHLDERAQSVAVQLRYVRPSGHADLGNVLHELDLGGRGQRGVRQQGRAGTDVLPVQPPALAGSMV